MEVRIAKKKMRLSWRSKEGNDGRLCITDDIPSADSRDSISERFMMKPTDFTYCISGAPRVWTCQSHFLKSISFSKVMLDGRNRFLFLPYTKIQIQTFLLNWCVLIMHETTSSPLAVIDNIFYKYLLSLYTFIFVSYSMWKSPSVSCAAPRKCVQQKGLSLFLLFPPTHPNTLPQPNELVWNINYPMN